MTTEKGIPMAEPQVNELVQALNVDPNNPPDLTVLNGFFGPSVDEANIRLYRSVLMNVWQDIPRDQIMHIDKIEGSPETPFREDVVWMDRRDARALDPQTSRPGGLPQVAPADDGDGFGDGGYGGWHQLWPPK